VRYIIRVFLFVELGIEANLAGRNSDGKLPSKAWMGTPQGIRRNKSQDLLFRLKVAKKRQVEIRTSKQRES